MTPEVAEVAKFVALQAPFSQLPEAATHYFVSHLEVVYLKTQVLRTSFVGL